MNELKPRIEFYRQRTFTEKLNAVFDFIRENRRALLRYTFYVIMPVCLVQTFAMNTIYGSFLNLELRGAGGNPFETGTAGFIANFGVLLLCILVGSAMISGLVYALMQTYAVRENRLEGVVFGDFSGRLVRNSLRCIALIVFMIVLFAFIVAFAGILAATASERSLLLTVPFVIVLAFCMLPLMLVMPTYLFERDLSFFQAFGKAWKLGTKTFWGMLGLMIVLYFISSVIQTVTMLPWYILMLVGTIFSVSADSGLSQSVIYKFALYILGLIQTYGVYVSSVIAIIGLAFQYFHAREKIEGVTIEQNISNFSSLGE
ncbi:MAG: hypothetical protein LBR18_07775 [Tannerella sp.]|jgi:hypothetical protein|nr:hypothetical protein [Tannerella sp.]